MLGQIRSKFWFSKSKLVIILVFRVKFDQNLGFLRSKSVEILGLGQNVGFSGRNWSKF